MLVNLNKIFKITIAATDDHFIESAFPFHWQLLYSLDEHAWNYNRVVMVIKAFPFSMFINLFFHISFCATCTGNKNSACPAIFYFFQPREWSKFPRNHINRSILLTASGKILTQTCTLQNFPPILLMACHRSRICIPSGADRTQVGPMLATWTLLSWLSFTRGRYASGVVVMKPISTFVKFLHFSKRLKHGMTYWVLSSHLAGIIKKTSNINVIQQV